MLTAIMPFVSILMNFPACGMAQAWGQVMASTSAGKLTLGTFFIFRGGEGGLTRGMKLMMERRRVGSLKTIDILAYKIHVINIISM